MTVPKHEQAASIVRARIASGALRPGQAAPSGAELARLTRFAALTCRHALRTLIADGTLVAGPSPNARARVAGLSQGAEAARTLSAALAGRRRAARLTQTELAALVGRSVTTVGHAETGRLWQSRLFWERADNALNAGGALSRLYDAYRAAAPTGPTPPVSEPSGQPPALVVVMLVWDDGTVTTIDPAEARIQAALDG